MNKKGQMFLDNNLKNKLIIYFVNILALMPLICFAFQHFSIDTYVYLAEGLDGHCIQWISCFRYFGSLISKLWFVLGNNPVITPLLDTIFFILFVALSSSFLSIFIYKKLNKKSTLNFVIINLSVLISVTNVWFINILTFPECIFATAIGVVLCFSAIVMYFGRPSKLGKVISAVLLICSTAIFQQFLVIFIIYSILLCSIELNKKENYTSKNITVEYLKLIVFILVSGVIYFVVGIAIQKLFSVVANERVALSIDVILSNFIYFATHQHSYLKGRGIFNTEVLTLSYITVAVLWIVSYISYIKKNKINFKNVCLFLSYIVAYSSSFLMGVISTSRSSRTMFGLFSVFALFSIGSILLNNKKVIRYILAFVLFFVFSLNVYKTVEMSLVQREVNAQEIMIAQQYLYEIDKYEKSENNVVNNIEICRDKNIDSTVSEGALCVDYAFDGLMAYISGRQFNVTEMQDNEIRKSFEENDWKNLVAEEQLIFKDDTLYLCVY